MRVSFVVQPFNCVLQTNPNPIVLSCTMATTGAR